MELNVPQTTFAHEIFHIDMCSISLFHFPLFPYLSSFAQEAGPHKISFTPLGRGEAHEGNDFCETP